MYLKGIRAVGFKSFADKVELDINKGITGIVGPNGSGKSNVVDAVRWVLGEQSVKALRGDTSMTDVIFAGSKTRNEQSRASVSLIFDNSDHYLNSDFNEIEIKRIVYKTGENEYYINNTKVRLKDITDLFLDSGAGKESFNIIGQGEVSNIISSKPEDRRVIFEEAAGVLKYKKRKEESYRKLEKTNENLERVHMLIDEILITLTPLKEQSEKARAYLDYKKDLEHIEIALIANDITALNNEYQIVKGKVEGLNKEVEKLSLSNSSDTSKVENLKLQSLKLDSAIEEKNSILYSLTQEIADLESKKQITLERQKYSASSDKLQENIIGLKEEIRGIQLDISSLTEEVNHLKNDIETKQLKCMELIQLNDDNRKKEENLLTNIQDTNKDIMTLTNQLDILNDNEENDTKLPYSVRNIIHNIRLKGIHGVLGKLIDVSEKYITCIDVSLGANSNVVVVDDEKSAKTAIEYLKENKLGRATFFPISIIKPRNILYEDLEKIKKMDGYIGTADSLVSYDEVYKNIVLNQLGNVIVVDTIDTLNKVGKKIDYKYKIVTLDGEVQYSGGAITGGTFKSNHTVLNQKNEIEKIKNDIENKKKKLQDYEKELKELRDNNYKVSNDLEKNQRDVVIMTESYNIKNDNLDNLNSLFDQKNSELSGNENKLDNTLDKELESILDEYYFKVGLKETTERELDTFKKQRSDLALEIAELEKNYREMNSQITSKQNELKNEEIKLGKMDVRLDNLLLTLSETYSITYEGAKDKYELDVDEETARITVTNLKNKIKSLGEVNTGSIAEYERLNERYTFLTTQKDDLETSVTGLMNVISEMDEIMKIKFVETFEKVKSEFQVVFKKLFKGGEGILELTNPDDILGTGIEISAIPPGKKLNSIALLSGGEKTLTAIALLFAILNVKPVPFVILDEVEAALDEANVEAFGNYLVSCKERSQFILITHKKRTMEFADALYGITMQESGVSKLVSVKLEG